MKRGAVQKRNARFVGLWIPNTIIDQIDRIVVERDTDRSKFIREAIRQQTKDYEPTAQ